VEVQGTARPGALACAELGRIVGEVFANIQKHADATLVWVDANVEGDRIEMRITDNGVGFDAAAVVPGSGGATGAPGPDPGARMGLQAIRERAAGVGGAVRVESAPYAGTTVVIELPVAAT